MRFLIISAFYFCFISEPQAQISTQWTETIGVSGGYFHAGSNRYSTVPFHIGFEYFLNTNHSLGWEIDYVPTLIMKGSQVKFWNGALTYFQGHWGHASLGGGVFLGIAPTKVYGSVALSYRFVRLQFHMQSPHNYMILGGLSFPLINWL